MKEDPVDNSIRRRITIALFVTQSLFSGTVILTFTLTPIIAAKLGGSDDAAGLPTTLGLVGRAAAAYPIGWLLDRFGRRFGLSLGYAVGVVGSLLAAWSVIAGSLSGFLTGAVLLGSSRGAAEQGRYIAAEVYPSARRAKTIGLIVFGGTIGAIGGPLLVVPSGSLADRYGLGEFTGPFLAAAILLSMAAAVVFTFLRPDPLRLSRQLSDEPESVDGERTQVQQTSNSGDRTGGRPLREIFANGQAILAVASMMISQMVMTLLMVITPLHMNHNDHGTQSISWVIMAHTLGMFGLSGVTGWLIDRFGRTAMIVAGTLVLVSACVLAPASTDVTVLAVALFLLGLGWNFCFVAGSSLLADQLRVGERGRAQGAGEMAVALGAGSGSLGSGLLFARGELITVSAVGLLFSLLLFGLVVWSMVPRRPAEVGAKLG